MGVIQHSGNACSGMCELANGPCGHEGCWQCEKKVESAARTAFDKSQKKRMEAMEKRAEAIYSGGNRGGKSIVSQMAAMSRSYSQNQTTTITREALESLCELAGLECNWNGGDPYIVKTSKDGTLRGKRLNDPGEMQVEGSLLSQAAMTIAQQAVSMDKTIKDMVAETLKEDLGPSARSAQQMREHVEKLARAKAEQDEKKAREVLKAQGASDDDISAAADLLRMK